MRPKNMAASSEAISPQAEKGFWYKLRKQKTLFFMSLPFIIYFFIFSYLPLWGLTMAFQNYKPQLGFWKQKWVGFQYFKMLFTDAQFMRDLYNTLGMSTINLVLGTVSAILFALLLNEIRSMLFKRVVQTISYLPHFLSWVVVCGLVANMLSSENGVFNTVLMNLGIIRENVHWMGKPEYFWQIVGVTNVWKEMGWNAIIYLAAMASIDPSLYEACSIDGGNRYHKAVHITLPCIKPTIIILLIMSLGYILNAGFEMQYLLGNNGLVSDVSETIDIFVIKFGIASNNYSLATAAGLFKSVVSVLLIGLSNFISGKLGEEKLI
jgi:putative aldouronate transport system permease protein